eukprot:1149603-Pelagomonas_calceolata.AAC.2
MLECCHCLSLPSMLAASVRLCGCSPLPSLSRPRQRHGGRGHFTRWAGPHWRGLGRAGQAAHGAVGHLPAALRRQGV